MKTIVVTGGAGFVGSALVRHLIWYSDYRVIVFDKLTHAGNLESLQTVAHHSRYHFERGDICNHREVKNLFNEFQPDAVVNLAAESLIDLSLDGPPQFINTNIVGATVLLETARHYWQETSKEKQFRFHHVSTDEVFGSLGAQDRFDEQSPYHPHSPCAASRAAADHLVRAWHETYGLPTVISSCSNNYGPYQFPQQPVPQMILRALRGEQLRVSGGEDDRCDWLHVEDHARALQLVMEQGRDGETYTIGGNEEHAVLDVARTVCALLDARVEKHPEGVERFEDLIILVADSPGRGRRDVIDTSKLEAEFGWRPHQTLERGLADTVDWYLNNHAWCEHVLDGSYRGAHLVEVTDL